MEDALITAVVFTGIAALFKIVSDAITRNKLINKGMVDEKVKYLFADLGRGQRLANLKWGTVLMGIGIALLIRQIAPFYVSDSSTFGLMFIFAGIGFLIYYGLSGRASKDQQDQP